MAVKELTEKEIKKMVIKKLREYLRQNKQVVKRKLVQDIKEDGPFIEGQTAWIP